MLSHESFPAFADDFVLFMHNTSWVDDEPYPNLLREKGGNGWPTSAFLAPDGSLLTQVLLPDQSSVEGLATTRDKLLDWQALKARVDAGEDGGEESLAKKLFVTELTLGMLDVATARNRVAMLDDLTDPEVQQFEATLVNMEFLTILATALESVESQIEAGKGLVAMFKANRIPNNRQIISYWQFIFDYLESVKDADMFETVFIRAQEIMAGDRRAAGYVRQIEARLKALRDGDS